nr:DNA polymerase III subunit beta [uncultured Draconibacterium sp.]
MKKELKISSHELYSILKAVGKAVSTKTTMPVLEYFHFKCWNQQLFITGSDLETTITTCTESGEFPAEGEFLIEHKLLMDALKELPEQPITINVDTESFSIEVVHANGKFNVMGLDPSDYPEISTNDGETSPALLSLESHVFVNGLKTALPFVANDELRPIMNGVFCQLQNEKLHFVASNANYLAELVEPNICFPDVEFILSSKASKIISDLADGEDIIELEVGLKNLKATFGDYTVISRFIEGNYPNYKGVIPQNNQNHVLLNVSEFKGALRRTTVFSNKQSNLVTLKTGATNLVINGKDIDLSISATENIACEYSGDDIEIGFKAPFLEQVLKSVDTEEVKLSMKDALGAALFTPVGDDCPNLTLLLMPMMINV